MTDSWDLEDDEENDTTEWVDDNKEPVDESEDNVYYD